MVLLRSAMHMLAIAACLVCATCPIIPARIFSRWLDLAVGLCVCALVDAVYVHVYPRRTRVICVLVDPIRATASSTDRVASVYRASRTGTIFDTFVYMDVIPPDHTVHVIGEATRVRTVTWQTDIRNALSRVRILVSQNHPRTIIAFAGNAPPNLMAYLGYVIGGDPLVAQHAEFVVVDTAACGHVDTTLPNFLTTYKIVGDLSPSPSEPVQPTCSADVAFFADTRFADTHGTVSCNLTAAISRALNIQTEVPVAQYTMTPPFDDYDRHAISLLLQSRDWMMAHHDNAFIAVDASARLAVCVGVFARACRATRLWFVEAHSLETAVCVACNGTPVCLERRARRVSC